MYVLPSYTLYCADDQNETLASAESMDSQPEVQWFMRPFLLDFLIEVHAQFRLRPEVLYLAINLVDRYVSKRVVYKKHYQLVGCAAMWTAAKFEDSKDKVPLVKELTEMCCKAYDESAFVQMEGHVLTTVGWNLGHPTAEAWLRLFNKEAREDQLVQDVTRFLMEITLYHRETVGIQSYDIASGAIILARFICGKPKRVSLHPAALILVLTSRPTCSKLVLPSLMSTRRNEPTESHTPSTTNSTTTTSTYPRFYTASTRPTISVEHPSSAKSGTATPRTDSPTRSRSPARFLSRATLPTSTPSRPTLDVDHGCLHPHRPRTRARPPRMVMSH